MKHKHAEIIKAWADNSEVVIEWREPNGGEWRKCHEAPSWYERLEYRIKPQVIYPVSMLIDSDMIMLARGGHPMACGASGYRAIANAAIRHAIDNGQVVVPESAMSQQK